MLQPLPPGFSIHEHKFSFEIARSSKGVWQWLNDTKTFTDTQVWPYKVEFYSPDPLKIPNGFHEKVLTNHTGPFVNFAGELTTVEPYYRDLQYFYGSYAIAFNWVRPYRLQFWTEEVSAESTIITCSIGCYVKPGLLKIWDRMQKIFWSRFESWANRSIKKR